jgi:hypothetical protein
MGESSGLSSTLIERLRVDDPSTIYKIRSFDHPIDTPGLLIKEVLILQICKERCKDRNVQALLLDEGPSGCLKRLGTVPLGNSNLCGYLSSHSTLEFHLHPHEQVGGKPDEMKKEEWEKSKWTKRQVRLI